MKIVHVEDYIHPDAGYQVNVLAPLQVKQGHSVEVVTAEIEKIPDHISGFFGRSHMEERDHKFFDEFKVSIHRIPLHAFVSGRAIFHAYKLFNKVRELSPDVVFVHGEDTYAGMLFILFSRWASYPIVLDCHMLEMASKNRFKNAFRLFFRKVMTPIILSRSIPLIRVVDSDFVEKHFGIPLSKTHYFPLGTDTGMFAPKPQDKTRLRQEYGLSPSAFVVLYAGKLDEQKGGALLGRAIAEKFPSIGDREIEFLIAGNTVGSYGSEVESLLTNSSNKVVRLPTLRYSALPSIYGAADLAIFPKQCSLSFFDVQSSGLPVLFEKNEINNQRVADGNAFTFEPGSVEDFRAKIEWLASIPLDTFEGFSKSSRDFAIQNFDFLPTAEDYTDLLVSTAKKWKEVESNEPILSAGPVEPR